MKAEIEEENYLRDNPVAFIDPEDWAPHLPQPYGKCFMCKLKFNPKIRMPLALPCGHNVCRDCVVQRETQELPVECFYDNCVIHGVYEAPVNKDILEELM